MSPAPFGVRLWIIISTCLVAGGWILSAVGQLNALGYSALLVIGALLCWRFAGHNHVRLTRFRRPLPLLFLVLAACALIGGALYAPTNWDGLAYRIPRVLNWLDAEKWHWIHSNCIRVNVRATGFEWLMTPLILFTKSDRALFLINFTSFLLLPGLIFSVFRRIGVGSRVAWYWMWLLPGGYAFALQAGSIGNDCFAAVYALAAVDFALRAQATRRFQDFAFSLLAVGLLTGAKASNLPLALVWFVAALPLIPFWLRQRPLASGAAAAVAALISFLPMAVLNHLYSGDWTGVKLESSFVRNLTVKEPLVGMVAHSLLLVIHNLLPPFFPFAQWYNRQLADFLPPSVLATINENFYGIGVFHFSELPNEDGLCGVGFGPTVLLLAGLLVAARAGWRINTTPLMGRWRQLAFCLAPVIALCFIMTRSGFACSRLITPFYPFIFGSILLFAGHRYVLTRRWWGWAAIFMMLLSLSVVVVTPPRPLFPAQSVFQSLKQRMPNNSLVSRAQRVYSVYAERADALRRIREALPADAKVIGFAASIDDAEVSLWRPFSRRRVLHVVREDTPETICDRGIRYVVLNGEALKLTYHTSVEKWCQRYRGEVWRTWTIPKKAAQPDEDWYIVKIADDPANPGLTLRADISETSHKPK